MDKQTELKAKIGECQLELEQLQARATQVNNLKQQFTQALVQEIKKPAEPKPEKKPKGKV